MKKLLSLMVVGIIFLSCCGAAVAEGEYSYEKELDFAFQLGLFPGEEVSSAQPVLRSEYNEIMNNIWGGQFSPYAKEQGMITGREAMEQMVVLLGYEGPAQTIGYQSMAARLKLTKNIALNSTREITYGELSALIYNATGVSLYEISSVSGSSLSYNESKDTFLSGVLKLRKVEGIMEDNGYTALDQLSSVGRGNIIIDGEILRLQEQQEHVRDWIGRKVSGYVRIDDAEEIPTLAALREEEYDEWAEFSMENFVKLSGTDLTFEDEEKDKTLHLSSTPYVIYNGKFERSLKQEYFDYEYGNVFVASSNGDRYDIVVIEGYISWYLSGVDDTNMKLYPSASDPALRSGQRVLNLEPGTKGWVRMYDKYGDPASIADFYANTVVDICENGDFIKVAAVDKNVYDACITEKDEERVYAGESSYPVSKHFLKSRDAVIPEIGGYYNLYINQFGYIIRLERISSDADRIGIFIGAESSASSLEENGKMKFFTSGGTVEIYNSKDKIRFTDGKNQSGRYTFPQFCSIMKNYTETLVSYKLNADGMVTELALPLEKGMHRMQGQLGYILQNEQAYYETTKHNLEGKAIVNDSATKAFTINKSVYTEKERYSINSISALGSGMRYWHAFNMEPDSPYVEYLLYITDNKITQLSDFEWFIVTDIRRVLDENGEDRTLFQGSKLRGQQYASAAKYYCEDDVLSQVTDVHKSGTFYHVVKGDVVLLRANGSEITEMYVLYKSDLEKTGKPGMIPGNLGYFDPANPSQSNPFILGANTNALSAYTTPYRVIFGYVQHKDSRGNMTITTQDLTADSYDPSGSDTRYHTEYVASESFMTEVKSCNNRVNVRTISSSEVQPYDLVGADCSRILVYTYYGSYSRIIIFNGEN